MSLLDHVHGLKRGSRTFGALWAVALGALCSGCVGSGDGGGGSGGSGGGSGGTGGIGDECPLATDGSAGLLDTTFGDGGVYLGPEGGAHAMLLQPDGKILVAGWLASPAGDSDFMVARLTTAGALDTSFGNGGFAVAAISSAADVAYGLALLADGRIIVVGAGEYNLTAGQPPHVALAMFTAAGVLDITFAGDGMFVSDTGTTESRLEDVVIDSAGRIVGVGTIFNAGVPGEDILVGRWNVDGTFDNTFSGDGSTVIDWAGNETGIAAAIQAGDKIVIAGKSGDAGYRLTRLDANGTPDVTFDGNGTLQIAGTAGEVYGMVELSDGRLVIAGADGDNPDTQLMLARVSVDGVLDGTFGTGGIASAHVNNTHGISETVAVAPNGSYVVSTHVIFTPAIARFTSGGVLDTTFGEDEDANSAPDGLVSFSGCGMPLLIPLQAVAVQSDGKIVAAFEGVGGPDPVLTVLRMD